MILLFIGIFIMSWVISARLKSKFRKYSQIALSTGLSGAETAELMLRDNGIHDVAVTSVEGHLTDHYNIQCEPATFVLWCCGAQQASESALFSTIVQLAQLRFHLCRVWGAERPSWRKVGCCVRLFKFF